MSKYQSFCELICIHVSLNCIFCVVATVVSAFNVKVSHAASQIVVSPVMVSLTTVSSVVILMFTTDNVWVVGS